MQISFLGIDIGKNSFHVALSAGMGKRGFNNSSLGLAALQSWLEKKRAFKVHACMEATGIYGEGLILNTPTLQVCLQLVADSATDEKSVKIERIAKFTNAIFFTCSR